MCTGALPRPAVCATVTVMGRLTTIILALSLLSSCTKSTKPAVLRSDHGYAVSFSESYYVDVEAPFEDAWATVVASLEDLEWTVATAVETSGLIATEETTIGTNRDRYACRQWPGSNTRVDEMTCKLTVHVGSDDGEVTRIRALADIKGRYTYISSSGEEKVGGWLPCTSTGEIETELLDTVLMRLEPLKYESPVYRKWKKE